MSPWGLPCLSLELNAEALTYLDSIVRCRALKGFNLHAESCPSSIGNLFARILLKQQLQLAAPLTRNISKLLHVFHMLSRSLQKLFVVQSETLGDLERLALGIAKLLLCLGSGL